MSTPTVGSFPVADLLPKKETNASLFLEKYPNYDGRGTVIGIFDTGVDPGAPGMQVTSDGKPKITHLINTSGSGDVDTSTVVKAENGTIKGLTGRTLKIPSSWSNPSGEYHIGVKPAYHIFPVSLRERCAPQWREKNFDPSHRIASAKAFGELNSFRDKNNITEKDDNNVDMKIKLAEAEIQAANDVLSVVSKEFKDLGPTWDCVVFHDGNSWQAAVDVSESGELDKATLLAPYSESFKYATLEQYWLNYSVNIYDSGNLLEIVTTSGSHGTHVAAITAANFPDDPSRNGIAPGAQIVSINIGYHHLQTMETINSLTRAVIRAAKLGVDVINMSYGEPSNNKPSPLIGLFDELVKKHNVLFCIAAGNEGTSISNISSPRSHSLMKIGAYLSTSMMQSQYSLTNNYEGSPYNFTCRGPSCHGALGPSVCAPGAAIASVPNYVLASYQLMNGTSMAAPNAAGCFALLVSALKQEKIAYSVYSVRRSVENTAFKPSHYEPFSMGHGLIQVDKAFEHLRTYQNLAERDIDFRPTGPALGIYRRRAKCDAKYESVIVSLKPCFLKEDGNRSLQENIVNFDLLLQCDKEWVKAPKYLQLAHSTRDFAVKLHPSSLSTGVHFAMIKAYDSTNVEKGPLFCVPVTYIVADSFHDCKYYDKNENIISYPPFSLSSGSVERIFIKPPAGAKMIHLSVKNLSDRDLPTSISILQMVRDRPALYVTHRPTIRPQANQLFDMNLDNESVVEVSISKSCLCIDGDSSVSAQISFPAIHCIDQSVIMHTGEGVHRINIENRNPTVVVTPNISLTRASTHIRPSSSKITQLTDRELISQGKQLYENLLTYTFTVPAPVEVSLCLTDFKGVLYDSQLSGQLVALYDKNKCLLQVFDSFKGKPIKIEKGTYTARGHLWHHSKEYLKKFEKSPLRVQQKLAEKCLLTLYSTCNEAMARGTKISSITLFEGTRTPIYAVPPADDNLQKVLLIAGSILSGSLVLSLKSPAKTLLNQYFHCVLDTVPSSKSSSKETEKETEKTRKEDHLNLLLDLKLTFLDSLEEKAKTELIKEIVETKCDQSQVAAVNICKIKAIEADTSMNAADKSTRIISLADEIIKSVNLVELLGSLELNKAQVQVGAVKNSDAKKVEKLKDQVLQAYLKKGIALTQTLERTGETSSVKETPEKEQVLSQLEDTWLNVNNILKGQLASMGELKQTAKFLEAFYQTRGDTASHLKLLLKMQTDLDSSVEVEKKIIALAGQRSEWSHLKVYFERCLHAKFPEKYITM